MVNPNITMERPSYAWLPPKTVVQMPVRGHRKRTLSFDERGRIVRIVREIIPDDNKRAIN